MTKHFIQFFFINNLTILKTEILNMLYIININKTYITFYNTQSAYLHNITLHFLKNSSISLKPATCLQYKTN